MASELRPFISLFEEEPCGPLLDITGRYDPDAQMWVTDDGVLIDLVHPLDITATYTVSGWQYTIDQGRMDRIPSEQVLDATD